MRFLGGAASAAAVLTVLALTGCGSQATAPTSSPTVTVAPTATATVAPTPSATPTPTDPDAVVPTQQPTTTSAADPDRPKGQCADDDIGVGVYPSDAGAGSLYYRVLFTNTGGTSCVLRGTPGVSVVGGGNGTQLGQPASRIQSGIRTVTLQAGDSVAAQLKVTNIGTDGGPLPDCTVQKGNGYRVYPPHSTRAFFYQDAKAVACAKGPVFMTVGPVGVG
jgi:hypothetical protein